MASSNHTHSNQTHILAKILKYFLYAIAFVPLIIFADYMSPFHFGKVIVFRSMIEIMIAFYLLLIWRDRSYLPRTSRVFWAFFLFTCAFSLATATSTLPYSSFWGSLERMGGLFTFWHYFIFFVILTSIFRKEEDWLKLLNLTIMVAIASAFYGFLQKTDASFIIGSGDRSRIFGTIGNPALFAGYEILSLFLSLMLFFRPGCSKNWKIFYGSSVLIITIAVLMTAVRGSMIAVAVGFLLFSILWSSAYKSRRARNVVLGLVGVGLLFVVLAMLLRNTDFVKNSGYLSRVTDFSPGATTVQTRFWAWQAGLKGWSESFSKIVVGWGPEDFDIPFSKYFNPLFYSGVGAETLFDRAHNMFVEILVTMGLVGLSTYLWMFVSALMVAWKKLNEEKNRIYGIGLISLIIAYAIHNSFIFDTSANFLVFFTVLGFISFLSLPKEKAELKAISAKVNGGLWFVSGVCLSIIAIIGVYYVNVRSSLANYATTRAIIAGWNNDLKGAVAKYGEALSYNVPGKYEYRNRFAQYVLEQSGSKLTPEMAEVVKLALDEEDKNIAENKIDYLPYLYSSRLYIILGKDDPKSPYNDKALEKSMQALAISPTFVRTYYEIAQAYLNKQDYDNAVKYFRKAVDLNPAVGLSWWYLGVTEMQGGKTDQGLKDVESVVFTGKYAVTESDYNRLINIYLERKDFGKLGYIYNKLTVLSPGNAQYHASYAVVLANLGKIDDAVAEAKKAALIDNKFEAEAQKFVQSLGRQW